MGYNARFKVWRGDDTDGDLEDFTVEVNDCLLYTSPSPRDS